MKKRIKINLPGPRWLQFIVIVILVNLLIYGIVAGSCVATGRCSTVDWSNRMFWGGMAIFAIGLPAVGSSWMGLSGSTGVGTNPVAMALEASAMHDVVAYEQRAQKSRIKFFWWCFAIGAIAMLVSALITLTNQPVLGLPPDFSKPDRAMPSKVVEAFDEEVPRSVNFIPISGATLAVWDGLNPVFIQGYGDTAGDINALHAIGGITQQFTAVAVLHLVEAGDLALDGVITAYIPELPKAYYGITVEQLLTHTSGLASDADVMAEIEAVYGEDPWHSERTFNSEDFLNMSTTIFPEPTNEPGTIYHPSEQGYRIIGLIIEAVSGESYNAYISTNLVSPAGLTSTAPCENISANMVTGHIVEKNKPVEVSTPNTSYAFASGNLCSTVADMVQWQYALNNDQIITAESLATLYSPAKFDNGKVINAGENEYVGLAGTLGEDYRAGYYASIQGSLPGYEGIVRQYYAQHLTVIVLSDTTVPELRKNSSNGLPRIVDQVVLTMANNWLLE